MEKVIATLGMIAFTFAVGYVVTDKIDKWLAENGENEDGKTST